MAGTAARQASEDALAEIWLERAMGSDPVSLRLVERAHAYAVPAAAIIWLLAGGAGLLASSITYIAGIVVLFSLVPTGRRLPYLAVMDLVIVFTAAAIAGELWFPMTIAALAASSIGWMISARFGVLLAVLSTVGVAVTGLLADAEAVFATVGLYGLAGVALAYTNGNVFDERTKTARRIAELLDSVPVLIWEADVAEARLTYVAGHVDEILGIDAEAWAAMSPADWLHPDDLALFDIDWEAHIGGEPLEQEIRARSANGRWVPLRQIVRPVKVGDRVLVRGVSQDISAERRAREAMEQYADIVERMHDGLLVLEVDGGPGRERLRLHRWNRSMGKLVGLTRRDQGKRLREVLPSIAEHIQQQWLESPERWEEFTGTEVPVRVHGDDRRWLDYELFRITDTFLALRVSDVTARKRAQDLLRRQASHDPLTDLPNRVALVDRLDATLAAGGRVGLLLLDLDQFKEINDTLGHHYGDRVLSILASRFSRVPGVDLVARLGGDEFAFLVEDTQDLTALEEVADRVAAAVEQTISIDDLSLRVGPSIGLVLAPDHGDAPDVLLQRADIAMYQAKRMGRHHQAYRLSDDRHTVDRLSLMAELPGLLDRDQLHMWFQPKVDLRTGRVSGVEALMRWYHPREGLLAPDRFIELLEVSGQLNQVTWTVLDRSLGAFAEMAPDLSLAVNLPARMLLDVDVATRILDRLALAGIPPSRLRVELTEREIMEDNTSVRAVLDELCAAGIRISIDDFGTGYSSLAYLRRLPVSEIKIDRTFVAGMLPNDHDYLIARAIIDLGHNLGHRIVAEGVEDEATLDLLRGMGCDEAQGYLFSEAVPPARLSEVIRSIEERWAVLRAGT